MLHHPTATESTSSFPVEQNDRAVIVDIVRGFALTGVLFANFTAYIDQQTPEHILNSMSSVVDRTLMTINTLFLEWKFMTLFSILFGYGFGLILESLERKNIDPTAFFARRMFWLFIFGCIHTLFWWADVLNLYAMSGILLLFFRKNSTRSILTFAVLCMFIISPVISYLLRNLPETFTEADIQSIYDTYRQGKILEVMRFNLVFYYKMFVVSGANLHDIVETLGRFLLGYCLLRIRLFDAVETKTAIFKKIAMVSFPIMIGYFILRWLLIKDQFHVNSELRSALLSIGILSTTTFYVSVLVLGYIRFGMTVVYKALQALGKMTLTNYLMISAFLVTSLYGFGFGKLGEWPISTIWICAFCWWMIEILFSIFWLKRFRYGPAEWIWRQLTYRKRLKLRKND